MLRVLGVLRGAMVPSADSPLPLPPPPLAALLCVSAASAASGRADAVLCNCPSGTLPLLFDVSCQPFDHAGSPCQGWARTVFTNACPVCPVIPFLSTSVLKNHLFGRLPSAKPSVKFVTTSVEPNLTRSNHGEIHPVLPRIYRETGQIWPRA